jgi:protein-S-isoprenylcysteine O-methyltransferase Ste14
MRNPIRTKNVRARFIPFYLAGGLLLWLVKPGPVAFAAGVALIALGAALRTWGAGHLVKTEQLTVTGPYARLRHPLYAGTLLVAGGFASMAGSWVSAIAFAALLVWFFGSYFPRKETAEALRLYARFGASFAAYRAEVPALVPRLRPWRPERAGVEFGDAQARWSLDRYSENNELGTLLALIACLIAFGLRAWALR